MLLAYITSICLMILLPVALAAWLRRVEPAAWLLFGLGALTFAVSQAAHLPLNNWLTSLGWLPKSGLGDLPLWRTALILGLTAGLCEELARAAGYLALRRLRPDWLNQPQAVMLGLGHGGIEAMIFGGVLTAAAVSALWPLRALDLTTLGLPPEQLTALASQVAALNGSPFTAALPLLERLLAMSAHVTFSLLVWRAFAHGRPGRDGYYIILAILYHAALDFAGVWAAQAWPGRPWLVEACLAGVLLPGWLWALWLTRREPAAGGRFRAGAWRDEWRVFGVAARKELWQLWRTGRVWAVGGVFLIFGLGSPLLAKLTPEMLGAIEGAEMFKNLIPTPTAVDAMTQYVKNLTQFGFILAVVLGMSAVVGEKERGVAALILSKSMPRWAFLLSKFTAQVALYLAAFGLSGAGAYYYTVILFGAPEAGSFVLLNALLLAWLLPFVGLSLLGSVLGRSTAAAGGIGLGLSVALMLAGSLPKYGSLLPGGLLAWAALAGQAAAHVPAPAGAAGLSGAAFGGAAASALVVVVMALVLALGVFEQQEL